MGATQGRELFLHYLEHALKNLYNPFELRNNPLVTNLNVEGRSDPAVALRGILLSAIEGLVPHAQVPPAARAWRVYEVLHRRYAQQRAQKEVAAELGLSIRQLQREEPAARAVLADRLLASHDLELKLAALPPLPEESDKPSEDKLTRTDELMQLDSVVPLRLTDVGAIVREALAISKPLLESYQVSVRPAVTAGLPEQPVKAILLKQALLGLLGAAARILGGGEVAVTVDGADTGVVIRIAGSSRAGAETSQGVTGSDLEMAGQLVRLCGGTLERIAHLPAHSSVRDAEVITWGVKVSLAPARPVRLLVIDDNSDARLLVQRYVDDTRFQFVGASGGAEGLNLARELVPDIILLDVMMPEADGWAILGQLRVHPVTSAIPVLVYSILSQEELALALGATKFIRKPVTQPALLEALEETFAESRRESD